MFDIDKIIRSRGKAAIRKNIRDQLKLDLENAVVNDDKPVVVSKTSKTSKTSKPVVKIKERTIVTPKPVMVDPVDAVDVMSVMSVAETKAEAVVTKKKEKPHVTLKTPVTAKNKILDFPDIVPRKVTVIVKRKNTEKNEKIKNTNMVENETLCHDMSNMVLENMFYDYYINQSNEVVTSDYTGTKYKCFILKNKILSKNKKISVSEEDPKKGIPVKFLNVFHRLKNTHMFYHYKNNIETWCSISENSRNNWKNTNLTTEQICKMLFYRGIEGLLLWSSFFS